MNTANLHAVIISVLAAGFSASSAAAEAFPSKPVRLVVPFPPGGSADAIARAMAEPLSRSLGQSVVVVNRPGANTIIGSELVARSPPDGHTVLVGLLVMTAALRSNLPFDSLKDFAPVARIGTQPYVLSVHPSLPAKSVKELIALARAHPGELTYSIPGYGSLQHLTAELFRLRTGIPMKPVVFQGGAPSTMAVLGGHVGVLVSTIAPISGFVPTGKLRALAVTSQARSAVLKDVPTMIESGLPDFEMTGQQGISAPAATPKAAIERLGAEIMRVVLLPEVRTRLTMDGYDVAPVGASEYAAGLPARIQKIREIAREANIKLD
ncbi:MAG: tripartite tricarboxylate transporter substrate binding protein [Betaproteobacteria bacterium]|nr:tripartite tricarboxylate transporter substrate binding protein [Betaproteobacteria bacterium]